MRRSHQWGTSFSLSRTTSPACRVNSATQTHTQRGAERQKHAHIMDEPSSLSLSLSLSPFPLTYSTAQHSTAQRERRTCEPSDASRAAYAKNEHGFTTAFFVPIQKKQQTTSNHSLSVIETQTKKYSSQCSSCKEADTTMGVYTLYRFQLLLISLHGWKEDTHTHTHTHTHIIAYGVRGKGKG